jgi:hypothetical protein
MNEDRLRQALAARADDVEVAPDALPRIRSRIATRRAWRRWLPAIGVAVTAATAAVVIVVATRPPARTTAPLPAGTAETTVPAPSATPPSATPSVTPQTGTLMASVPVYYAGDAKLYREYHNLRVTPDTVAGRVIAAVNEMLRAGSADDPDYATLWPAGISVRNVTIAGGIATVDLSGAGASPPAQPGLAVQQLVWTVAAAVADTPVRRLDGIRLLVAGAAPGTLWGSVDVSGALRQAPAVDVLAPVWLIEPHEGASVGKTFTVHLAGIVFEATVRLRVRSSAGQVVKDQTVTLNRGAPAQGEATLQVTAPPGRYTVEAFYVSARDGSEQGMDDHSITVR